MTHTHTSFIAYDAPLTSTYEHRMPWSDSRWMVPRPAHKEKSDQEHKEKNPKHALLTQQMLYHAPFAHAARSLKQHTSSRARALGSNRPASYTSSPSTHSQSPVPYHAREAPRTVHRQQH